MTKARLAKLWRSDTRFSVSYQKQAAKALRNIRAILNQLPSTRYICPTEVPAPCKNEAFPKTALNREFESILKLKLPKGLKHIAKAFPQERKAFLAELDKQPNTYTYCPK